MTRYLQEWRERHWKPFEYWVRRIIKGKDDDDYPFDHPWAIH